MADNYTQFSFLIPNLTPEEQAWSTTWLTRLGTLASDRFDEATEALRPLLTAREQKDPLITTIQEYGLQFQWELDTDQRTDLEPTRIDLWIYAEESGDPEQTAAVVHRFLKQWRPKQFVTFSWADTCSKPRLDEFSGGAALITARGVRYWTPSPWIEQHRKRLAKRGITEAA